MVFDIKPDCAIEGARIDIGDMQGGGNCLCNRTFARPAGAVNGDFIHEMLLNMIAGRHALRQVAP